ncbi:MAG TPA: carboxypeptidase-like regulatory domain-containing protein [Chitinophagales bacterium]|nr:carboxypeptidase-like regulatory domain-containing protein [Chitinophagales bacterium]HRK28049.1 carboxypeptidase-like regulatory domain-containing protein [Chitinophagales bacterium]
MRKFLFLFAFLLIGSVAAIAQQSGEIQGKVTDKDTGEPIPFANVSLVVNGTMQGAQTDFDGFYSVKPLPAGSYTVKISYVGYQSKQYDGVVVYADRITFLDVQISEESELLKTVEVVSYKVPLLEADKTSTGSTVTKEQIMKMPTRNVASIASQTAGVFQSDEGGSLNVKGQRSESTDYYIDGIKVRGSSAIPAQSIEQLTVITGGLPARFGDATGGIINITTRGPSQFWSGGVELISSKFLEPYGYYLGNFSVSGPLLKKGKGTPNERPILGLFLSGEYLRENDDRPSAVGIWKTQDDVLENIRQNPILRSETGGFIKQTDITRADGFEKISVRQNVQKNEFTASAKLDFQPVQNINITFGGTANRVDGGTSGLNLGFLRRYELFNSHHMPDRQDQTYRGYARITQRFSNRNAENAKPSAFSNAYYSLQFDFTKNFQRFQDPIFQDRLFDYGYAGKFTTYRAPQYGYTTLERDGISVTGLELQGLADTLVTYQPGGVNSDKDNHNLQYYALAGDNRAALYSNLVLFQLNGGIRNGNVPASLNSAYNLWYTPGTPYSAYQLDENDQARLVFNGSFDIKRPGTSDRNKHAIEFGFEYEQRVDRSYDVFPMGLWNLMFQRNSQFGRDIVRDLENPILIINGQQIPFSQYDGISNVFNPYTDTITYNLIRAEQSYFDRKMRERFGYGPLEIVNTDDLNPNDLSLDMFSPDELFNNGNNFVSYYGYDYLGNKLKNQPAFEDFWKARNEAEDIFTRPIGAFRPIYMAGFIQDKFAFRDLIFNVGVRVDRFDANLKVPKDQYSPLYATRKAGEVSNLGAHPGTIGDDYVVYVDNEVSPTKILGYRDGTQWYDATGAAVADPRVLVSSGGTVNPYLAAPLTDNPKNDVKNPNYDPNLAFEDYKPQINIMPRVAFSFEISDEAIFFAHYDILTQRPQGSLITTPYDYFFFAENAVGGFFNNPNLRPERTVDYQIGFKQKVSNSSAITISAFYRELKDMIQVINVPFAYPSPYNTFGNQDFGTVKGLEFAFDLRRTGNLQMSANYTLQFADATGSGNNSQSALIDFGLPNLRTITPVSYDARHMFNINADYRFDRGKNYNGPKLFGKDILANTGINLILRARSGTPYSRQANPTPSAQFGVRTQSQLDGSINGSRLPFNFRVDLRLERDIPLQFGRKQGKADRNINIYLLVQNLLDADNVVGVYGFTGSASDDGYVTSAAGLEDVRAQIDPVAFVDQYNIKVNNPAFFSLPRRARLGVMFNF